MSDKNKQNILEWLPLATFILSFAVSWGIFITRISADEGTIASQDIRIQTLEKTLTDLRIDTATIKSDVSYIKAHI